MSWYSALSLWTLGFLGHYVAQHAGKHPGRPWEAAGEWASELPGSPRLRLPVAPAPALCQLTRALVCLSLFLFISGTWDFFGLVPFAII